jgi:hypothetical protein
MKRSCDMFKNDAQSYFFLIPKVFPLLDCYACDATYGMTISVSFPTPNVIHLGSNIKF